MKKIISFLIIICIFILSSCSNPSKPKIIDSKGETNSYKYALKKQDEDETFFIIEEEIEFKEGYNPLSIKEVVFVKLSRNTTPIKIKIDDEEMEYQENILLKNNSLVLTIYENKSRYGDEKHVDLCYHILIEYKDLKSDNIFTK